jgi:hypothetical protein
MSLFIGRRYQTAAILNFGVAPLERLVTLPICLEFKTRDNLLENMAKWRGHSLCTKSSQVSTKLLIEMPNLSDSSIGPLFTIVQET